MLQNGHLLQDKDLEEVFNLLVKLKQRKEDLNQQLFSTKEIDLTENISESAFENISDSSSNDSFAEATQTDHYSFDWNGIDYVQWMSPKEKAWFHEIHVGYWRARTEDLFKFKFREGPSPVQSPVPSPEKLTSPNVVYVVLEGSEEKVYHISFDRSYEKEVSRF